MFAPPVARVIPSPVWRSSLESSRLLALLWALEARVDAAAAILWRLLTTYSPFPFEVTGAIIVLGVIAIRQVVLWYALGGPPKHAYVYWKLNDLIQTAYYSDFLPEQHMCTAIIVYLTQKLWLDKPLTAAEVRNKSFMINLLSLYSRVEEDEHYSDSEEERFVFRGNEKLMVPVKLPIYPFWTPAHQDMVEVCTWMSTRRRKNCDPEVRRSVFLRARKDNSAGGGAAAEAALGRFVEDALTFYFANGYADRESYTLRMFCATVVAGKVIVRSVPLTLGPTLDTVFFPQRERVKSLLARFARKEGRYAIPGFPHKLGFLLYGPRGTGKRSFVRALAHHTRRHIVRVSLSSLTRSDQLCSILYLEPMLAGSASDWKLLTSRKVIFLLEDVDTNDDLVRARESNHVARVRRSRGLTTRDLQQVTGESVDAKEFVTADWASQSCRTQARAPEKVGMVTRSVARVPPLASTEEARGRKESFPSQRKRMDKPNLSSLLNVLDGVVEEPEQIVVMIVDHPERLDPALLRPGRLTTHLRFDYIELDDLLCLCGLFFGAERCEAAGTLDISGETKSVSQRTGCSYSRLDVSAAAPPPLGHGGLMEASEHLRAELHPSVADASKETEGAVHPLHEHRTGISVSAAEVQVKERVLRRLSVKQATQVRSCIAALEREASSKASDAQQRASYNFLVTPSHVHHLCMSATDLSGFLDALSTYIRSGHSESNAP
ncbi:hypothetical protein CUR178_00624 [Leishmania enriettii]|uniref:AAA+ ATPase domain-containing protein n=1 Tax=Leishmania enriettii TaxID=5663 RepID=A0A836G5S8_LEIEN|nr:hypothetical protein CUR178_00624 [Leishmania enriettii]